MKQTAKTLPSHIIKTFLDFVENAKSDYNYNLEAMRNVDMILKKKTASVMFSVSGRVSWSDKRKSRARGYGYGGTY